MDEPSLNKLKIPELKAKCKELGITGISKLNKPALVAKILAKLGLPSSAATAPPPPPSSSSSSSHDAPPSSKDLPPLDNSEPSPFTSPFYQPTSQLPVEAGSPSEDLLDFSDPSSSSSSSSQAQPQPVSDPSSSQASPPPPKNPSLDPTPSSSSTLEPGTTTTKEEPVEKPKTKKKKKRPPGEENEGVDAVEGEQQPKKKIKTKKTKKDVEEKVGASSSVGDGGGITKEVQEEEVVARPTVESSSSSVDASPPSSAIDQLPTSSEPAPTESLGSSTTELPAPKKKRAKKTKPQDELSDDASSSEPCPSSSTSDALVSPSSTIETISPSSSSATASTSSLQPKPKSKRPAPPPSESDDAPSSAAAAPTPPPSLPPKKKLKPSIKSSEPSSTIKPPVFKVPLPRATVHIPTSSSSTGASSSSSPSSSIPAHNPVLNPSLPSFSSPSSSASSSSSSPATATAPKRSKKFVSPLLRPPPPSSTSTATLKTDPTTSTRPKPTQPGSKPSLSPTLPLSLSSIQSSSSWLPRVYRTLHLFHPSSDPNTFAFDSIAQHLYPSSNPNSNPTSNSTLEGGEKQEGFEVAMRFVLARLGREVMGLGTSSELSRAEGGQGLESRRDGGWGRVVEVERVGGKEGKGEVWRVEVAGFEDEEEDGETGSEKGMAKEGQKRERKSWVVLGATGEPLGLAPPPPSSPLGPTEVDVDDASPSSSPPGQTQSPSLRDDWSTHVQSLLLSSRQRTLLSLVQTPNSSEFPSGMSKTWWESPAGGGNGATEEGRVAERYVLASCVLQGISGSYQSASKQCDLYNGVQASGDAGMGEFERINSTNERNEDSTIQLFLPLNHHLLSLHLSTNLTASPTSPLVPLHSALALVVKEEHGVEIVLRETGQIVGAGEDGVGEVWRALLGCDERGVGLEVGAEELEGRLRDLVGGEA